MRNSSEGSILRPIFVFTEVLCLCSVSTGVLPVLTFITCLWQAPCLSVHPPPLFLSIPDIFGRTFLNGAHLFVVCSCRSNVLAMPKVRSFFVFYACKTDCVFTVACARLYTLRVRLRRQKCSLFCIYILFDQDFIVLPFYSFSFIIT